MRRRELIAALGGAAVLTISAGVQQPAKRGVGFVNGGTPDSYVHQVAAFRQGLTEAGYIEGQNVAIEYRWAKGQFGHLPALAADLVNLRVAVLVTGGSLAAQAAKSASATIPV